jgi:hypothetical protein
MVIAVLFGKIEKYPTAISIANDRSNLAIWAFDEAIIGTTRGKWKTSLSYEKEDNLADSFEDNEVKLGDFSKLGRFLQGLIDYNQTKMDEK